MILAFIVYVVMVVLPTLKIAGAVAFGLIGVLTLIIGCTWFMPYTAEDQERGRLRFNAWLKGGWLKFLLALVLLGGLTPNKEVSWYMVGAYAAEKVITADATKELAGETYDMFRDLIKKARENVNPEQAVELAKKAGDAVSSATQKESK